MQSKDKLTCKVFLRIYNNDAKIIDFLEDEKFRLLKTLYELCDTGGYYAITTKEHLINDLRMPSVISNPC